MNPRESEFKTLAEVGRVGRGKSRHRPRNDPDLYGGEYPFVQTGDVKHAPFYLSTYSQTYNERGLAQSKLWPPGTLCITIAANIADTAILTIPACFPDSILGFQPKAEIADVRYVKYCLDGFRGHMEQISKGTTQDNLSLDKLLKLRFWFPDLDRQKKIAAILSVYDDLIANNQRRIALLESMAEKIYREWFVRGRFPGAQRARASEMLPFEHLCILSRGFDLPDSDMQPGDVPVIASTTIKGYHNVAKVRPPVVTTGRSGSLGTVLFVNQPAWPLNTALYVKDFKGNSPYLVFFTLKNLHLENFNAGAGVPTLNRNHLAGIRVHVPPRQTQKRFDEQVGPILQLSEQLRQANEALTTQRDSLLPRLISGKLRVDHLDIQLPPSMRAEQAERVQHPT